MRARGIAGRHDRREICREDEDPPVAIDYGYLKLDGKEDDDVDEMPQNSLLILVAKDVKSGKCAASCLRGRGVSEYATPWLVSLLRRLGYRRAILQSDGEPPIVALKTATLLAFQFVELAFCVEAELEGTPRMVLLREVKRQTRTLKFALEAHAGKIVESHSILEWIPTMAADATSFVRIGKDGVTTELGRSGRA